ncbi:MAG: ATP-binding protein [Clostridiales Family XIII bacterium]|jgi:predicted AAA+ superfamily ATPase|nr:ATP-binding protein [Clostridiales Family XIII bacterium]
MYINRLIEDEIFFSLKHFPVTAITGPRQCGKSTLARKITAGRDDVIFLDLERPEDLRKLQDPQWFFTSVKANLFCIDEIQRMPEIFPLIRSLTDEWARPGCFLILGSASRDLLRQSSESLAGRISYKRMSPFLTEELPLQEDLPAYITRGGFPRSLLADHPKASYQWREDFIQTFLERDLLQWRLFTPATMRRLWQMLAHMNGQSVNYASLASALDMTGTTVKSYIDLLSSTYMIEVVAPWFSNMKKRLVKAPKVYVADSGITACLLGQKTYESLIGHPAIGAVWEQVVLSNLRGHFPDAEICYYRTAAGSEMDFVMRENENLIAIECKFSLSPGLNKGNHNAIEDIRPARTFLVTPAKQGWPVAPGIQTVSLKELIAEIALAQG